jgi:hypothetical protein
VTTISKEQAAANAINAYVVEMAEEWQTPIKRQMQLENLLNHIYCIETYAESYGDFENVIQAYQGKFTPTGAMKVGAYKNELVAMKTDLEFSEDKLEQFSKTQFPLYHPAGQKSMEDNQFIQKMLGEFYFNAWVDEMAQVAVNGVRVEPTPGQPGTVLGSVNGFNKVFNDGIAAGTINTITTGVLTNDDIVDQLQYSLDQIPKLIRAKGGTIYFSEQQAIAYSRKYKKTHDNSTPVMNDPSGTFLLVDDYTKFKIRVINEKDDFNRFWIDINHMGKTNMIVGKHKIYSDMPSLTAYPDARTLKVKAEWHRFYGLRRHEYTFITKAA